ncbi:MAG: hypothetical protein ACTSQ8_25820 [Candidatus Helarchaeota archaeon]
MKDLRIVHKNNKPYGIRDDSGFLLFFPEISKYPNQEKRYKQEIEQQYKLADLLIAALKAA